MHIRSLVKILQTFSLNKNIPRASIFPFLSIVGDFQFYLRPFPDLTANRRVQRLLSKSAQLYFFPLIYLPVMHCRQDMIGAEGSGKSSRMVWGEVLRYGKCSSGSTASPD